MLSGIAQYSAFAALHMQAAGNFLFGRCGRIVPNEIKDGLFIWETHEPHIGEVEGKCARLFCDAWSMR